MQAEAHIIPIFFKILMAFILINILINLFLLYTKQTRIYKYLALYWPVLFCVYLFQSKFQQGELAIALAYSVNLISCSLFAMVGFEVTGRVFPIKKYILYFIPFFPLTILLHHFNFEFNIMAMPLAIATATPLVHAFTNILILDYNKTTRLQKLLALVYGLQAIHCINFALFRMEPDTQIWGWTVAFVLYDFAAILLPAIALEETNMSENIRLQNLVDEKTAKLNRSLKENERLLKIVLHDISSPLMTMRFYLEYMKDDTINDGMIEKAKRSQSALEKIILDVKNSYGHSKNKNKFHLQPVGIEDCFNDVSFIFAQKLEKKNVNLIFNNQLSPNTRVLADQTTLTHSVLSNLVSNGLKFSNPNSSIKVTAKEELNSIILEIQDQGPGMPDDVINNLFQDKDLESSLGTSGEAGTGFGLSIVKSIVDSYGGSIEFNSKMMSTHPHEHGTNIKITLDRA